MVSGIDWPATGNWRGERLDARRVFGLTAFTFACQRFERIKRNRPLDLVADDKRPRLAEEINCRLDWRG